MKKKNIVKKMEDKSCLNISDWVTFLSSEKHGMMSSAVNYGVLLVAVIALILATSGYIVYAIASVIIAMGCVGWAYFKVLRSLHQRGNLAGQILGRIMSGELKDGDSIREEWVLGLTVIRRGWLRQGKGRLAAFKRAWRRQWKAELATFKETWYEGKVRLVAFKETWWHRWEAGLATFKETWWRGASSNR